MILTCKLRTGACTLPKAVTGKAPVSCEAPARPQWLLLPLSLDPSFLPTKENKILHSWFFFQCFPISETGWAFGTLAPSLSIAATFILACTLSQGTANSIQQSNLLYLTSQPGGMNPQRTWETLSSFTKFQYASLMLIA